MVNDILSVMAKQMSAERWWNGSGRGKSMFSEINVSQLSFIHYKSRMIVVVSNPGLRGEKPATEHPI